MSDAWHNKINWADTIIASFIIMWMVLTPVLIGLGMWWIVEVILAKA